MTDRRTFMQAALASGAVAMLPRCAFADAATDARFVLVILRGALDGLAAVPPYGDGNYAGRRGPVAITSPEYKLDGLFGLHPSLTHLHERYRAKELVVLHAVATAYRERSHFDGQDLLENGTAAAKVAKDGWLNRLLPVLPLAKTRSSEQIAIAAAQNVPLVLRGDARVSSWAPSVNPETRTRFRIGWQTPWNVDVAFTHRYISEVELDGGNPNRIDRTLDAEHYFDLFAGWAMTDMANVRLGINNVLDNDPSITTSVGTTGNGNTYPQVYDALGRYLFGGVTVKF